MLYIYLKKNLVKLEEEFQHLSIYIELQLKSYLPFMGLSSVLLSFRVCDLLI